MFSRKYSTMPMIFHANGSGQNGGFISTSPASITPPSSSYSSSTTRFSMFRNLQNIKPCGSCGGK